MNLPTTLENILLDGVRSVPDETADLFFDHVARACNELGNTINERALRRAVNIAVNRCRCSEVAQ